ncbi:MAG TPA: hypothetical protein VK787_16825 [Puia sp.]|jgi:hypothetical protein|nr:hypothetical protein [Puia sp.]
MYYTPYWNNLLLLLTTRQTWHIKTFLTYNGFENVRRYDYYNKQLGLLLEDIHDENVLTDTSTLFFIDTVFYIDVNE